MLRVSSEALPRNRDARHRLETRDASRLMLLARLESKQRREASRLYEN